MNKIKINNTVVSQLGQGTWHIGDSPVTRDEEIATLRWGIDNGLTLIDTAEMYGEGASERLIGEAIVPYPREDLYLVSKVYPWNAGCEKLIGSCQASLDRLGTDYVDLYLLHWQGSIPLKETVQGLEELRAEGKIRNWGVSNFDLKSLETLLRIDGGQNCAVVQNLYHLGSRGAEFELLPYLREKEMAFMAYCPLAQAGDLRRELLGHPVIADLAKKYDVTKFQILLAFVLSNENVIAIPKASSIKHVEENRVAADISLSDEDLDELNRAFPAPKQRVPLDVQ